MTKVSITKTEIFYFNEKYLIYDQNNVWHKMMAHILFDTISHADITEPMTGKIDHLVGWEQN